MKKELILTDEQQIAVDAMKNFLQNPGEDVFTLAGVGGAGKTTVVKEVVKNYSNIIGATVSHSAKFVLQQSLGDSAKCITIAKLLGLKQMSDSTGEVLSFVIKD